MKYKVQAKDGRVGSRYYDTMLEAEQCVALAKENGYEMEIFELEPEPDMVNHPPHYTRGKIETIDGLESAVEGLEGKEAGLTWNVIKYMWRWKFKGNPLQDLRKAEFYLKRLINHVEVEG